MNRIFFAVAFAIGLLTVTFVGLGFVGSSWMALLMTAVIAGVYLLGAFELKQFRAASIVRLFLDNDLDVASEKDEKPDETI